MKNEIERKFFVKEMPDLKEIEPLFYERYFLERRNGIETRISKVNETYKYEKKIEISELERTRESKEITKEEFDKLKQGASEAIIRERYDISVNPKISIQIYHGRFDGLVRAEVEFESEEEAKNFVPLDWMEEEMTGLPIARDGKLIDLKEEEFKFYLKKMTEEYLDILDESGNKTGEKRSYLEAHEKGLIHTAVHVWIVNSRNEIIIQKRKDDRRFYPGHWDISAAGHVSAGQTSLEAAMRETEEELDLKFQASDFTLLCTLQTDSVFNNGALINKEFNPVYVVKKDIDISEIKLLDGEVEAVKFLTFEEFKKWIENKGEKMVPHEEEYAKLLKYLSIK